MPKSAEKIEIRKTNGTLLWLRVKKSQKVKLNLSSSFPFESNGRKVMKRKE
jgi:hypothetical protein